MLLIFSMIIMPPPHPPNAALLISGMAGGVGVLLLGARRAWLGRQAGRAHLLSYVGRNCLWRRLVLDEQQSAKARIVKQVIGGGHGTRVRREGRCLCCERVCPRDPVWECQSAGEEQWEVEDGWVSQLY